MSSAIADGYDPQLDILLERTVEAPVEQVWAAWTKPEWLTRWFAPAPFEVTECEVDARPGGVFRTVMRSVHADNGALHSTGCFLEVVEHERLSLTTVLGPGFRPMAPSPARPMTVLVSLEATRAGTAYAVMAKHADDATRRRHIDQGFMQGWGVTLDQLEAALARTDAPDSEGRSDAQTH